MFCVQCGKSIPDGKRICPSCGTDMGYFDWLIALRKLGAQENSPNVTEQMLRDKATDEAILTSIGDGLIVTDNVGRIVFINRACETMIGWTLQEISGKEIGAAIPRENERGEPLEYEEHILPQVSPGEKIAEPSDVYFVRKDKTRIPVSIITTPIVARGNVVGAVEVFRDIGREKKIDAAKSDFISIASHQLRTPLSALGWLVESLTLSLKNQKLDPVAQSYLDDLTVATRHAVQLVENLLNASRIESGSLIVEPQNINVLELVGSVLKDMKPYADLKKHSIILTAPGDSKDYAAETDPKLLQNILQNLIANGIDHSPEGSAVQLMIAREGETLKVSTSNKSPYIPQEEQTHLFERFYRGESVQRIKAAGFGLGLFISKSFVEALGGTMGFESKPGEDVVFWFTLPKKMAHVPTPQAAH